MCDPGGAENVEKTLVVACIPAFNEERTIARVVLQARRHVDRVLVCDDGSEDLTGAVAENTCFYVSTLMISYGGEDVWQG